MRDFEIVRRHKDLSEARDRLPKKDRHSFHVVTRRLLKMEKDWDAVVDGEVVARSSDRTRLKNFMEGQ